MQDDDDNEPTVRIDPAFSALLARDSVTAPEFEEDDDANTEVDLPAEAYVS